LDGFIQLSEMFQWCKLWPCTEGIDFGNQSFIFRAQPKSLSMAAISKSCQLSSACFQSIQLSRRSSALSAWVGREMPAAVFWKRRGYSPICFALFLCRVFPLSAAALLVFFAALVARVAPH